MQIGVTVVGFMESEGALYYSLNIKFVHPSGQRGEINGTVPFAATQNQAIATAKQMILDSYGITVPTNAQVKVVGL
jgi:hypothetical protein